MGGKGLSLDEDRPRGTDMKDPVQRGPPSLVQEAAHLAAAARVVSLRSVLTSICRMRSRVTENCWPTSSSVWSVMPAADTHRRLNRSITASIEVTILGMSVWAPNRSSKVWLWWKLMLLSVTSPESVPSGSVLTLSLSESFVPRSRAAPRRLS